MTLDIEEGEQFTVGSVEVMGLNPDNADTLVIKLKPGDIFGQNLIEEFYKDNQSVIPGDASLWKNTEINQDPKNRTAAIVFDFRGCQEPPSEHRLAQEVRVVRRGRKSRQFSCTPCHARVLQSRPADVAILQPLPLAPRSRQSRRTPNNTTCL